jgi:hypothetical protein
MKTTYAAVSLAVALALSGCAENHASIEMFAVCAPPEDAIQCGQSGGCDLYLASARPWMYLRAGGQPNGLELFTEVRNQMPENDDASAGRVNTNDVIIQGYELDFTSPYYTRENYFYPANFGLNADSVFAPVIKYMPEEISLQLRGALLSAGITTDAVPVTIGVRLKGRTVGGTDVETGTFEVTVDVFNEDFPGFACPKVGDVITAICPNTGQTASVACETPEAPAPATP